VQTFSPTPSVFRASLMHRGVSLVVFFVCWFFSLNILQHFMTTYPLSAYELYEARLSGISWGIPQVKFTLLILGLIASVFILLWSLVVFLIIETTQVMIDDLGVFIHHAFLPQWLSRRLGSGRLSWKHIIQFDKKFFFFKVVGEPVSDQHQTSPILRFILVDHLEELVIIILERSPQLRWKQLHD